MKYDWFDGGFTQKVSGGKPSESLNSTPLELLVELIC